MNGYNYNTFQANFFSLIRVLKSKKKKLALILFYCLGQKTWLDDSWKHFNNKPIKTLGFLSRWKIQKCLT